MATGWRSDGTLWGFREIEEYLKRLPPGQSYHVSFHYSPPGEKVRLFVDGKRRNKPRGAGKK